MPDLGFSVTGVEAPAFTAVPTLLFTLSIKNATGQKEPIHSVALRCQIQIEVRRRHYDAYAQEHLLEIFGEPERWGETVHNLVWMHTSTVVPAFTDSTIVELPLTCTYDFEVVSTKYFSALTDGEIPLLFLFSGTVFYVGQEHNLQVSQIPWSKEARYRLPVAVWHEMIERYYPNYAWLRLRKDLFEQLYRYKATHSLPTWDDVIVQLLEDSRKEVGS